MLEKFNAGNHELSIECHIKINGKEHLVRNVVMPGEENNTSRYAMIFVRDITEAEKEADQIREMTRQNAVMDKLIQGTIRLVDHFAMCNPRENTYKVYSILPNDSTYGSIGNYDEFINGISSQYKVISEKQTMKEILSLEHLNKVFDSIGDIYKFEYCSLDERIFKNMAVIPLSKTKDNDIDNLIAMTKNDIEIHNHNFEVRVGKIYHENVSGDSLRIQQIIINVMSNAVKYTPDGGNIIFSIEERHDKSKNIGCYEFTIEDNGIGMTKEFQKIIFESFTRADDKRTSKIQGTGLGMTVVRNIVNMMNGNIKIESEPGKGSRFTITIFLKLQEEEKGQIEELLDFPVLVVDDDEICCENAINILEDIGLSGEWTTSGEKAVELTKKRHEADEDYFAVIVDLKMPGMNGIETRYSQGKNWKTGIQILV